MKGIKKKLPNKAYILFMIYEGNISWYNKNAPQVERFLQALMNHNQ